MSRCYCCNKILSKLELSRKFVGSGNYTEMCTGCLQTIDVAYDEPEIDEEDSEDYDDE